MEGVEGSGNMKTKTRSVRADAVLVDVSEAYGASGIEPEGFRDIAA